MFQVKNKKNSLAQTVYCACSLVFLGLAVCLSGCKSGYPASASQSGGNKTAAKPVKTALVAEMPVGKTVTVNGTLAAYDQTTVSVKVPGRVKRISVDLGSVVKRGQMIAQI